MNKIFCLLIIFVVAVNSIAQETKRAKELFTLAGTWNVDAESRLSLNGPWETSKAKAIISYTLDSSLLEEYFTGLRQGKAFLAKTFFAVNNMTNKFQRIFIDAPHGVLVDFEGEKAGDSIVFDKDWKYANGTTVKLRVVYKNLSPDEMIVESMRMGSGQTAWDINGRMKYHRVK